MSTEFENSNVDLEQLLRTKAWEQLTGEEQAEVKKVLAGADEYMRMFAMTNRLIASSGVHDEALKPPAQMRANLLNAFANEQRKRRAAWWDSLWYGLSDKLRFDIPAVRIAMATVVVALCVFGALRMMDSNDAPQVVKNEATAPVNEDPQQAQTPQNENNIAQEPSNGVPPQNPGQQNMNSPQQMEPYTPVVMQPNPDSGDLLAHKNMPAFVIDSSRLEQLLNNFCCGTSNGTVVTSNNGNMYGWTPGNSNVANGLPARARSLENDAEVLDVFFALK